MPLPSITPPPIQLTQRYDPALDGLRGVAVLMVFVFHYGGGLRSPHLAIRLLGTFTAAGWTGVVLFFALSGFLITGGLWDALHAPIHASSRPKEDLSSRPESRSVTAGRSGEQPVFRLNATTVLRNFYARRALRILPLYYAALIAASVVALACRCGVTIFHSLAVYALFLQNLPVLSQVIIRNTSPLPLYHLWSLAVEEQFYLLWPALLLLARTRRGALHLCGWSFALAFAFRAAVYALPSLAWTRHAQLFDTFLLTQCGALLLGAAVALGLRGAAATRHMLQQWAPPAFVAGVALYALSSWLCGSLLLAAPVQYIVGLPAVSLASAALLLLLLHTGVPRTLAALPPLPWLGRISYGFYVFHILLQPLYDRIAVRISHAGAGNAHYQIARLLIALCLTTLVSWLAYQLLELPFLRAKRHFPLPPPLPLEPQR
jgi:peptidoglycan/LPS O-acetylase OafA/YrhL